MTGGTETCCVKARAPGIREKVLIRVDLTVLIPGTRETTEQTNPDAARLCQHPGELLAETSRLIGVRVPTSTRARWLYRTAAWGDSEGKVNTCVSPQSG